VIFPKIFQFHFPHFFSKIFFLVKFHLRDHRGLFMVRRREVGRIPSGVIGEGVATIRETRED